MNPILKSNPIRKGQQGMSLLELLISMTIGLFILAVVLGMFVSLIKSDSDNIKAIQLNQELRAAMSLMTRDLRRSGYNANAAALVVAGTANPFQEMANTATCIIYAYDADEDGVHDGNTERFGFRLNGGAIESRESGENCAGGTNWDNITDDSVVEITAFNVSDPDLTGDKPTEADFPGPGKTVAGITTHQITLTLSGRLVRDHDVTRSITETVEIRNDEY